MFFNRTEKVQFGGFIRALLQSIIAESPCSYDDYLESDPQKNLEPEEFEAFRQNRMSHMVFQLYARISDEINKGKIKISSFEELGRTFTQALLMALEDNDFNYDNATSIVEDIMVNYMDKLFSYLENQNEQDILKNGMATYVSLFYTDLISQSLSDRSKSLSTLVALIKNDTRTVKANFDDLYNKVKLIV